MVVGLVETHHRADTEAMLAALEQIPPAQTSHRGSVFAELDMDKVLARRPAVVLVDELAHTCVPGSRHEKRWEDVQELLTGRYRCDHRAQRATHRQPQRRRRSSHRHRPTRDGARRGRGRRRRNRVPRHHPAAVARPHRRYRRPAARRRPACADRLLHRRAVGRAARTRDGLVAATRSPRRGAFEP